MSWRAPAQPALEDVLHELLAASRCPDPETLEEMVRRYPGFAAELTDFAAEWRLQEELPEAPQPDTARGSAVDAAMGRLRRRLDEAESAAAAAAEAFASRSAEQLKDSARALGIDVTILAKLRDRRIEADTVPAVLQQGLAEQLTVPAAAVAAHLAGPPTLHPQASFKSETAPRADAKESFRETVRRSRLSAAEKRRWLPPGQRHG